LRHVAQPQFSVSSAPARNFLVTPSAWAYSVLRDSTVWTYVAAGAAGAVPGGILSAVSSRTAAAALTANAPGMAMLLLLPAVLLWLWAIAWWAAAVRRAVRYRRLARAGVLVEARVRQHRLLRGKQGHLAGVVAWLEYDVEGRTYQAKKRTTLPGVAAQARDLGRVNLAVDPQSPTICAFIADGRLG
jgi:hypothetical protein